MATAQALGVRVQRNAGDALVALAIWLLILWGVGAQWWAGMNSPDSQFSASIAIFGDQINERSIDPSYYWTRLGYLAPVNLLTAVFGTWNGFAIWRGLLVLLIVISVYWIARQIGSRALATALTLFIGLNTMVLAYLGNPYATGTAMAASLTLFALAIAHMQRNPQSRRSHLLILGCGAGCIMAWLVMLNPYNAFLAGCTWLGLRIVGGWISRPAVREILSELAALLLGFAFVFISFLAWGLLLFPGRNWIETYRSWNARLDYSSFISDTTIWLHDLAALVVLLSFLVSVVAVVFVRNRWSASALVTSSITIAFTLLYMQVIPGPWIEAPHYAAMCWPGALLSIVLAIGAIAEGREASSLLWLSVPVLVVAMVWAGRSSALPSMTQGILMGIACVVLMLLTTLTRFWSHPFLAWIVLAATVIVIGVCAQLLQNGRGNLGIYSQYPMNSAYVDYQAEALMRSNVEAEQFVLAHTSADDRVAIWTDPARLTATVAAMQLWGAYNNAPGEASLDQAGQRALRDLNPTVIALYAPSRAQIDQYFDSIPAWFTPTPLECTSVPYLGIGSPDANVCLTHIRVQ
ncbi:MAG: hypothetical protein Q7L55_12675 [Actinomycetota bacterium]|nr:hypothetical protein [Actinomycetota bacterium]